jgi:hypothetical protein
MPRAGGAGPGESPRPVRRDRDGSRPPRSSTGARAEGERPGRRIAAAPEGDEGEPQQAIGPLPDREADSSSPRVLHRKLRHENEKLRREFKELQTHVDRLLAALRSASFVLNAGDVVARQ